MDETTNGIRSKVTFHLCSSRFSYRVSSYHIYFVHNRNLPYPIFIYTKNRFCFRTLLFPLIRFRPRCSSAPSHSLALFHSHALIRTHSHALDVISLPFLNVLSCTFAMDAYHFSRCFVLTRAFLNLFLK